MPLSFQISLPDFTVITIPQELPPQPQHTHTHSNTHKLPTIAEFFIKTVQINQYGHSLLRKVQYNHVTESDHYTKQRRSLSKKKKRVGLEYFITFYRALMPISILQKCPTGPLMRCAEGQAWLRLKSERWSDLWESHKSSQKWTTVLKWQLC